MHYKIINRKKLMAVKFADSVIGPVVRIWNKISGQNNSQLSPQDFANIKKILILRTAYTGDVIMTLPVLTPLRSAFPNAELVFLTSHSAAPLLEHHPAVDRVIKYDAFWFYPQPNSVALKKYREIIQQLRAERFEVVFDFRGDIRDIYFLAYRSRAKHRISYGSGGGAYWLTQIIPLQETKHRVQFHLDILRALKISVSHEMPKIYLTETEKKQALTRLQSFGFNVERDVLIGIHPGARMPLKRWPIARYAELIARVTQTHLGKVVLFTAPEIPNTEWENKGMKTWQRHSQVAILSDLTLRELAAIIHYCRILICNDSAPMHLAAAVGTKCLAIFGPSKSYETAPYGSNHFVIEKPYPCRTTCDESTCKYKIYNDCLKSIRVDDVEQSLANILNA
ncbi:MAG: glycosyltransferase family 9 protein [bacterium]|nr:glycosyltransferase family 9 protein [bacterium]